MSNTINILDTFVLAADGEQKYLIGLDRRANWIQLATLGSNGFKLTHCTESQQDLGECHVEPCKSCKGKGDVFHINGETAICHVCVGKGKTLGFSNFDNGLVTLC